MASREPRKGAEVIELGEKVPEEHVFVLLTESYEFGEFSVEGVFSSIEKVNKYVEEELSSSVKYEVMQGRYNP